MVHVYRHLLLERQTGCLGLLYGVRLGSGLPFMMLNTVLLTGCRHFAYRAADWLLQPAFWGREGLGLAFMPPQEGQSHT